MRFTDRVAIITAAASGIGRATADIMAREGAVVVAVDIDEGRLDATVAALRAAGGRAHGRRTDVLDAAQVDALVASVTQEFGAIDILVNAVGGSTIIPHPGATMDQLTLDDWQRLIAFNLDGTFLFCHAVAPIMKRQRRGKIVNLSSIAGRGLSEFEQCRLCRGQGRDHRLYPQDCLRARTLRHQRQRDRPEPHPDRAHPPALGAAEPRRPGGRNRAHAAAAHRRSPRPSKGDLFPGLERRRFRHRRHDRRDRRQLTPQVIPVARRTRRP